MTDEYAIGLVQNSISTTSTLNQRPGCARIFVPNDYCDYSCGIAVNGSDCDSFHHRSAFHFLNVNPSSGSVNVFRFVSYKICYSDFGTSNPEHRVIGGLSWPNGKDIIVSTRSGNTPRYTIHEISHLYGVLDHVCTKNQPCVMDNELNTQDEWCDKHKNIVWANR